MLARTRRSRTQVLGFALLFCAIQSLSLARFAFAEDTIPQYLNFQGRLTDTSGNALNGDFDLVIRLYDATEGGTAFWTETHEVSLTEGLFNVMLGKNTALDWEFDAAAYLSIEVVQEGVSDGEMDPRLELAASAYAFNAERLDGLEATSFLRSDEDGTLDGALAVTGDVAVQGVLTAEAVTTEANTDLTVNPTGTGNVVLNIDSASTGFRITDAITDFLVVAEDGNVTLTGDTGTDLVTIAVGNLKVGDATPSQALDGEDAFIEGDLETDGTIYVGDDTSLADGVLTLGAGANEFMTAAMFAELTGGGITTLHQHVGGGVGGDTGTTAETWTVDADHTGGGETEPADGSGFIIEGGTGDVSILWDLANDELDFTGMTGLDIPATAEYLIGGNQIATADLADGSNLTFDNVAEVIGAGWTFQGANLVAPTTDISGLSVRQTTAGAPTANVFEITDSGDTTGYFVVDSNGDISISGDLTIGGTVTGVGDIEGVTAGTGLTGGGSSGTVTLDIGQGTGIVVNADDIAVDVGTGANQIVQLNASSQLPAVSGVNLTELNADNIDSGTLDDARLSANVAHVDEAETIVSDWSFDDGAGDSPMLQFAGQTGAPWQLYVDDVSDDLQLMINSGNDENLDITNISGNANVFINGQNVWHSGDGQLDDDDLSDNDLDSLQNVGAMAEQQGDLFYYNGGNWTRLPAANAGDLLQSGGAGANPSWTAVDTSGDDLSDNSISDLSDVAAMVEAQGDIFFFDGADWNRLAAGVSGQLLQTQGATGDPQWTDDDDQPDSDAEVPNAITVSGGSLGSNALLDADTTLTGQATRSLTFDLDGGDNATEDFVVTASNISVDATGRMLLSDSLGIGTTTPQTQLELTQDLASPFGGLGRYENLALQSETFTDGAWVKSTMTALTDAVGPTGAANSAATLTNNGGADGTVTQTIAGPTVSQDHTLSVWLKAGTSTTAEIELDGDGTGETPDTTIVNLGAGWQRYSVTHATVGDTANMTALVRNTGLDATTILGWGAQVEEASQPGVYVKTTAASVAAGMGGVSMGEPVVTGTSGSFTDDDLSDDDLDALQNVAPMVEAQGGILYVDGSSQWNQLAAAGTAGWVLQSGGAGANPSWTQQDDQPDDDSEVPNAISVSGGSLGSNALLDADTTLTGQATRSLTIDLDGGDVASEDFIVTANNVAIAADGSMTLAGQAVQTGADDDQPDDDSEVPNAITLSGGTISSNALDDLAVTLTGQATRSLTIDLDGGDVATEDFIVTANNFSIDAAGAVTAGGSAVVTTATDDDQPDDDSEVPNAITVSGGTIANNNIADADTTLTGQADRNLTFNLGGGDGVNEDFIVTANNWSVDAAGNMTVGGAAVQTGADDDQPDDDSEVPDAITVSGGTIGSNALADAAVSITGQMSRSLTINLDGGNEVTEDFIVTANNFTIDAAGAVTAGGNAVVTTATDDDQPDGDSEVPDAITLSGGTIGNNNFANANTTLSGQADRNLTINLGGGDGLNEDFIVTANN
ncbi:MAG: hypothetical protein JW937_08580, partial [Candidatus Omnitrophica bacterium]|nr:hypothetical protein [Candidatus Omnitrophota bacterium]